MLIIQIRLTSHRQSLWRVYTLYAVHGRARKVTKDLPKWNTTKAHGPSRIELNTQNNHMRIARKQVKSVNVVSAWSNHKLSNLSRSPKYASFVYMILLHTNGNTIRPECGLCWQFDSKNHSPIDGTPKSHEKKNCWNQLRRNISRDFNLIWYYCK